MLLTGQNFCCITRKDPIKTTAAENKFRRIFPRSSWKSSEKSGAFFKAFLQMGHILIPSSLMFDRYSRIILPGTCSTVLTAVWRPWGVGSDMASRQASEYKQHSWLTYIDIWRQGLFSFIYEWNIGNTYFIKNTRFLLPICDNYEQINCFPALEKWRIKKHM